jgi:hypothetical protein
MIETIIGLCLFFIFIFKIGEIYGYIKLRNEIMNEHVNLKNIAQTAKEESSNLKKRNKLLQDGINELEDIISSNTEVSAYITKKYKEKYEKFK